MNKKKIGIITFHYAYNYGSVLQAFAMQTYLLEKGYEAKIIDYIMKHDYEQYKIFRWNTYLQRPQSLIADIFLIHKNLKRMRSFKNFVSNYLSLTNIQCYNCLDLENLNDDFEVFICGSDQIWNFDCTKGVDAAYFLDFAAKDKLKIAYAPSVAQLSFDYDIANELKKYLSGFNAISVREKSTAKLIEDIIRKKIDVVVDPTLLLKKNDYLLLAAEIKNNSFLFVYELEENTNILRYARKIAKEKKLQIIYLSNISKKNQFMLHNVINAYGCSPNDFLGYIKNAEYIITNSFHATIFSIVFEKKFCTFRTKKNFPRIQDLLQEVDLEKRIYNIYLNIYQDIDYVVVGIKLDQIREKSYIYLFEALSYLG